MTPVLIDLPPNPTSGPKNHNNNTMTLFDKNGTTLQEGDYVKFIHGGYYQVSNNPEHVFLVCDAGHSCKDIPYAFTPELYEKVLPSEVRSSPEVTYPIRQILDPQTGTPIAHSLTISNLWVDVNSQAFYFTIDDSLVVLTHVQAATLRDFLDERLKTPL